MITNLHIKNIGIIEDIDISFNNGLNVLTGETGAGKSLIIDSLNIICGGRFSKEMIRKGENNSFVEICLYEPENEKSIDGNIIISREININGRNMCKINGRMVTVNELKEFMKDIMEIHGQNDNQSLLEIKEHIKYLDEFCGDKILNLKKEYTEFYKRYIQVNKELKENYGDERGRQRELDLLKYQFNEIDEGNLVKGEEELLEKKQELLANSENISSTLEMVDISLSENVIDIISNCIKKLEKIENIDQKYKESTENLRNAYYEIQEVGRDMSSYREDVYFDKEEQYNIEDRLNTIYMLKKKYGNSIEEIIQYKEKIEREIYRIENLDEYINDLNKEKDKLVEKLSLIGNKIHNLREENAVELSKIINQNLTELEMKNANISIRVKYLEDDFFENGKDKVEFFISTNLGEDEKELSKIASGGEMSRIMLAIKTVFSNVDKTSILVFDEIDTGISGKAANSVAEKLNKISNLHQVLCISHLPSIAALADFNYYISKSIINDRTLASVKMLEEQEIIYEIARISSGEINEETINYAKRLRCKKLAS